MVGVLTVAASWSMTEPTPDVTCLTFSQDLGIVAVGTWQGFMLLCCDSLALLHREAVGHVCLLELALHSPLLAFVGGMSSRDGNVDQRRRLTLWNTTVRSTEVQLDFPQRICGVRLSATRAVVLLRERIHVLDLQSLRNPQELQVLPRSMESWVDASLSWLCAMEGRGYLAFPVALPGPGDHAANWANMASTGVGLADDGDGTRPGFVNVVDAGTLRPVGTVLAHRSPIQALSMNLTGQLLATASSRGTLIRVFSLPSLDTVGVFRRGTASSRIFSLHFARDARHLVAAASSGTVHIFRTSAEALGTLREDSHSAPSTARSFGRSSPSPPPSWASSPSQGVRAIAQDRETSPPPSASWATPLGASPERGFVRLASPDGMSDSDGDLDDWTVLAGPPERPLEAGDEAERRGLAAAAVPLQRVLASAGGKAAETAAQLSRSLLELLPQPCRDLVDAPRAFAWLHMKEEERHVEVHGAVAHSDGWEESPGMAGYVACVLSRGTRAGSSRHAVLVASARGGLRIYDWSPTSGGQATLHSEHSFMDTWLQDCRAEEHCAAEQGLANVF